MNKKINILSKLDFNNLEEGNLPSTINDNNKLSSLIWNKSGNCTIENNDNIKLLNLKDNKGKIYSSTAFINNLKNNNFQLELDIILTNKKVENIFFGITNSTNNNFYISIFSNYIKIFCNNKSVYASYFFETDIKYNIVVEKKNHVYTFYVDGHIIGYCYSNIFSESINTPSPSNITIGAGAIGESENIANMNGYISNVNFAYGGSIFKYENSFSKYGNNLLSYLNFGNIERESSNSDIYPSTLDTIKTPTINWNLTEFNKATKNGYIKLNGEDVFNTNNLPSINTLSFKISNINNISNNSSYLAKFNDDYYVNYNILVEGAVEKEPDVVVLNSTTSALNFENGYIDRVSNTTWNVASGGTAQNTNVIFGESSFENTSLGGLYTNSKIITGGSIPYTIEFYALIKGNSGYNHNDYVLFSKDNNSSDGDNYVSIYGNYGNKVTLVRGAKGGGYYSDSREIVGNKSIGLNDINKYTFTYDGGALRCYINDKLDTIVGTNKGFSSENSEVFRFLQTYIPAYSSYNRSSLGIIDNINIHDGIATKLRNTIIDDYEDNLIVDLSFDAENNSKNIIDNSGDKIRNSIPFNSNNVSILSFNENGATDLVGNNLASSNVTFNENYASFVSSNNSYIAADIPDFRDNHSDFTIELWYRARSITASGGSLFAHQYNSSNDRIPITLTFGATAVSNYLQIGIYTGTWYTSVSNWSPTVNVWHHIAISKQNDTYMLFADGIKVSELINNVKTSSTQKLNIGRRWDNALTKPTVDGDIRDFRIIKGKALYTTNFVPSTEPYRYLPRSKWLITNDAKITNTYKLNGYSSLYLYSPSGSHIKPEKPIELGDTYTMDMCFYPTHSNDRMSCLISADTNDIGKYLVIDSPNDGGRIRGDFTNTITKNAVLMNQWNRFTFIVNGNDVKFILNGVISNGTINENSGSQFSNDFKLGRNDTHNLSFEGYIDYFKIYNGVEVVPKSTNFGKIQLDFENNVNDKYSNSNWSNSGVTFNRLHSVDGFSGQFSNSSYLLSSSNSNLNFENKNFEIEYDFKSTNTNVDYGFLLSTNHSSFSNDNTIQLGAYGRLRGLFFQKVNVVDITGAVFPIDNQFYNTNINRKGQVFNAYMNDVLVQQYITSSKDNTIDFSNGGTRIGSIGWGSNLGLTGYLDNFKTYKEDIIKDYTNQYGEVLKTEYLNDDLIIKCSQYFTNPLKWHTIEFSDFVLPEDFIIEFDTYFSSDSTSLLTLIYKTKVNYSLNHHGNFGYCLDINNDLWFGRGNNASSPSDGYELYNKSDMSIIKDNKYHKIKLIVNGDNHKLYIDDALLFDVNDSEFSNVRSTFALSSANNGVQNRNMRIKNINIYDLDEKLLYHKDFKSKINKPITRPVVHLPLETNAINIGSSNLTINSVGNPTYTTVDGKKCIKFESGKYLSINSNNIFNLGTSTDFYIEFDFYIIDESILNVFLSNHTSFTNNSSCILYANKKIEFQFNNGTLKIYPTINTCEIGQFNNLKLYRMNNAIYMNLNGVETIINDNYNINFSISNLFLGKSGWSSTDRLNGYMSNFKLFVGTSEIPETYNDKKVLDLDFAPTGKSYLFKDNNNKCVIHPVNITQRDYKNSQYCCTFNGTNQYLQLGKNDIFNFGLDDFVLEIKFSLNQYKPYSYLFSNGANSSSNEKCGIAILDTGKIQFLVNSKAIITNETYVLNDINNFIIIRENGVFKLILNDVVCTYSLDEGLTDLPCNFNGSNNSIIGSNLWDSGTNPYFNGTIYSLKVLRNTSNVSDLIMTDNLIVNETITLTNGVDVQEFNFENVSEHDIKIINDENKFGIIIDGEYKEVSKDLEFNSVDLFEDHIGLVKDIKVFDTAIYDEDSVSSELYDTEFDEVDVIDVFQNSIIEGEYIVKGFIEGDYNKEYYIYNRTNKKMVSYGFEDYEIEFGINELYIDDYEIYEVGSKQRYKLYNHQMKKGHISGYVNVANCEVESDDLEVLCFRSDNKRFIGSYSIVNNTYTINNLDVNSQYDIILSNKSKKIENKILSNRTPIEY